MLTALISAVLTLAKVYIHAVSTEQFYHDPNTCNGSIIPIANGVESDSSCVSDGPPLCLLSLDPAVKYYGSTYNFCIINSNGIVELTNGTVDTLRKFDSSQLPIANHTFVAPFYADIDASGICGDIIYNTDITKERDALQKAADQISNGFSEYEDFMPEYLILAMWYNVGYADQPNDDDKRNSFQCVIATDGSMTFAIFLYAELQWNTAKDSAARVGFNDGINNASWEMPCSGTADISDAASTSNVNMSGVWLFRIDQENIIPACVDKELCASDTLCSCLTEDKKNCKCQCSESSDSCKADQEEVCMKDTPAASFGGVTLTTKSLVFSIVLPTGAILALFLITICYMQNNGPPPQNNEGNGPPHQNNEENVPPLQNNEGNGPPHQNNEGNGPPLQNNGPPPPPPNGE